jgi:hypothetical protein
MSILLQQSRRTILLEIAFALILIATFWLTGGRFVSPGKPPADVQPGEILPRVAGVPGQVALTNCTQLVINDDFEDAGGWTIPLTARPGVYTDELAYTGERSLRLGIPFAGRNAFSDSTVYQSLDLPGDAEQITLQAQVWRVAQPESQAENDFQYLQLIAPRDKKFIFRERSNAQQWETITYDLTPFKGQHIRLLFGAYNDGGYGKVAMYVDAVHVEACRSSGEPPPSGPVVYLPIVSDQRQPGAATPTPLPGGTATLTPSAGTPSATNTPTTEVPTTPVAPPTGCEELLPNGGFEQDRNWIIPVTTRPAYYTTEMAYAGKYSLRLGIPESLGNVSSDSTAYQWLTLPGDAASITLSAQVWRGSTSADSDFQYLWVTAGSRIYKVFQGHVNTQRWETITYDLTALRGQRIRVLFGAFNNGRAGKTVMFVDEVSVESCTTIAGSPTPTVTPTPGDYAPVASMSSPDFGVQAFLWWRPEIARRDLMLIQAAGFNWVRQSFSWEDIEQSGKGSFNWENADRVVQDVNDRGLKLLARVGLNPDIQDFWAGTPPANADDFADFLFALASRYNCTSEAVGCIQAYQIWNEPNLAREWGNNRPSPSQYVYLLGKAYAAIKRANPNAIVISAGMAPTGTNNAQAMPDVAFYQGMYRAMGNSDGYFDMLGVHAAGFAAPPELDPAEAARNSKYGGQRFFAFRHVEDVRAVMVANGDADKRIAVLEFGWTSDPVNPDYVWHGAGAGIDEAVKADYLVRAYQYAEANWQPWIGVLSVITMPNLDWLADGNPEDEEQYWWAIMEPSQIDELHFRPAYVSLCTFFNHMKGTVCVYDPNR